MIPEDRRAWYLVALIIVLVLAFGALVYFKIREPAARPWDYGTTPFVPGQSQYGIHRGTP
ncbi:MAG: hypothetical protein HY907_02465 [Deltaproteobacteria bacterium]|nr:hypothetical protein [Deltaproteobacteria bacterium]